MPVSTRDHLDMLAQIDPRRLYRNIEDLYYRAWDPLTELNNTTS